MGVGEKTIPEHRVRRLPDGSPRLTRLALILALTVVGLVLTLGSAGPSSSAPGGTAASLSADHPSTTDPTTDDASAAGDRSDVADRPASSGSDTPVLLRRLAALAILLGAGVLVRRAPRGRAPTGSTLWSTDGIAIPMPNLLWGVTPGVLRV